MAILSSYTRFENELLAAAYFTSNIMEKDTVSISEIAEHFKLEFSDRWALNALSEYWANGLTKEQLFHGSVGEQRIWLTASGLRKAESLINSGIKPAKLEIEQPMIDSTAWTGLPRAGFLDEDATVRLKATLAITEDAIAKSSASNEEKSQARAYVIAMTALADAPEPPADLIWEILSRANAIAGIAGFFLSLVALFQAASN